MRLIEVFRKPKPGRPVASRVEEMAREKYPTDEFGRPSPAQVEFRANLANRIRRLCSDLKTEDAPGNEKLADEIHSHFLDPR